MAELADALEELGQALLGLSSEMRESRFEGSAAVRGRVVQAARLLSMVYTRSSKPSVRYIPSQRILEVVAQVCRVGLQDLLGRERHEALMKARILAVYVLHEPPSSMSFAGIGRLFGRSDHTSSRHLFKKATELIEEGDGEFLLWLGRAVARLRQFNVA